MSKEVPIEDLVTVEYKSGPIKISRTNILVEDIDDMQELEFWEKRLKEMKRNFAVAFSEQNNQVRYMIFSEGGSV